MAKAVQGLPEFLAMKRKLTIHTAIQGEIFKQLELRDLREVGKLEQGLVFGELKSRDLINAMQVRDQCFCCSRCINYFSPEIVCLIIKMTYFLDQSIQKRSDLIF